MKVKLTMAEFRSLVPGDKIFVCMNNEFQTATVENYAFYNAIANKPNWFVETNIGLFSMNNTYREVEIPENMKLIDLNTFQNLKEGDSIFVFENGKYVIAQVCDKPFLSESLENILSEGNDWEVETDIGFVHNDSVYVKNT